MGSLFDGYVIDYMHAMLDQEFGVSVTLSHQASETPSFTARRIHRTHETLDEYGVPQKLEFREYLLPVSSVTLNGETHKPQKGDRITETIDGEAVIFEILPMAGLPAVEPILEQERYRVRTNRIYE